MEQKVLSENVEPLEDCELLEEVVRAMVEMPEAVRVTEKHGVGETTLWIDVAPIDRGKIIGKKGKNIDSLRNIFSGIGALQGKRLLVMVAEPGKTFTRPPRQGGFRRNASQDVEIVRKADHASEDVGSNHAE